MSCQFRVTAVKCLGVIILMFFITSIYAQDITSPTSGARAAFSMFGLGKKSKPAKTSLRLTPVSEGDSTLLSQAPKENKFSEGKLFPASSPVQQQAFQQVASSAMPLTPTEIKKLKAMMYYSKRAAAAPVGTPPKPVVSTQLVSLAPGATPPVVRLEQGFVTTVLFVDDGGNPWPIQSYDLGDAKNFNIQWSAGSNALMIQAMNLYNYGNLAVTLKGLPTPVVLTLVPGQKEVDYRVDFQIQQVQPGAEQPTGGSGLATTNQTLLNILNGIPPTNAKVLKVAGGDCDAWLINKKLYLRTKLTVLSPGWISMMKNPDGTKAYEMSKTTAVLASKYGVPIKLQLEGIF